jgi:hypothetical protein
MGSRVSLKVVVKYQSFSCDDHRNDCDPVEFTIALDENSPIDGQRSVSVELVVFCALHACGNDIAVTLAQRTKCDGRDACMFALDQNTRMSPRQ